MKKERYRLSNINVILKEGDFCYRATILKGYEEGGYTLLGYIRKENAKYLPKKEDAEQIRTNARFPDEEAFNVVERLIKLGYVTEGGEFGGQFRVMFDDDLNLRYDEHYDRPGRPYPKNAEEFRKRLKREF